MPAKGTSAKHSIEFHCFKKGEQSNRDHTVSFSKNFEGSQAWLSRMPWLHVNRYFNRFYLFDDRLSMHTALQ